MQKRFLGVWKLLSVETHTDAGTIYLYGKHPVGRLAYDEAGRMSVQVMRPERQSSNADGYLAYYGTYTLDEQNETVIHHVEACTLPEWIGTEQRRHYEFEGIYLTLSAESTKLVWERLP